MRTRVFDPSNYKAQGVSQKKVNNSINLEKQLKFQIDNSYTLTRFKERCSNFEADYFLNFIFKILVPLQTI